MGKSVVKPYSPAQKRLLTYLLNRGRVGEDSRTEWSVKDFLGHRPSKAESASVSRLLSSLVERGHVVRVDAKKREGKRKRTTEVELTDSGRYVAQAFKDGYKVTQTSYSEQLSIPVKQYDAALLNKYLLTRELNAVDAALADEPDDYTPYNFRSVEPGSTCKTESEVRLYRHMLNSALEVARDDLRKMYEETERVFYKVRDVSPPGTVQVEKTEGKSY